MEVKIESNIKEFRRSLNEAARKQIPFATARTLTLTARQAVQDVKAKMPAYLDRPTPFTQNSFYSTTARKGELTAEINIRSFAPKGGTPPERWLSPEIFGGERRMKRFEKRLSDLSGGQYVIPGRGVQLDQYGNVSRGEIQKILSRLQAFADTGQNVSLATSRRLKKKGLTVAVTRHRSDYFVAKSKKNGRPLGIYRLIGPGRVEPVFIFTPTPPSYTARFPYRDIIAKSIAANFAPIFERALVQAIATANR